MKRLPKKLSDLILLALGDLEAVERSSRFKVDMKDWFSVKNAIRYQAGRARVNSSLTSETAHCTVCFAGAVMARSLDAVEKSLNLEDEGYMTPYDFGNNENKLQALNSIRLGDVRLALHHLGRDLPESWEDESHIDVWNDFQWAMGNDDALPPEKSGTRKKESLYKNNPKAWKQAILSIVGLLQAEGL